MFRTLDDAIRATHRLDGFVLHRSRLHGRTVCEAVLSESGRRVLATGSSELAALNRAFAALAAERRHRAVDAPGALDDLPDLAASRAA